MTCQRCLDVDKDIIEMIEKEKRLKALLRSIRIAKSVQIDLLRKQIEEIGKVVEI